MQTSYKANDDGEESVFSASLWVVQSAAAQTAKKDARNGGDAFMDDF